MMEKPGCKINLGWGETRTHTLQIGKNTFLAIFTLKLTVIVLQLCKHTLSWSSAETQAIVVLQRGVKKYFTFRHLHSHIVASSRAIVIPHQGNVNEFDRFVHLCTTLFTLTLLLSDLHCYYMSTSRVIWCASNTQTTPQQSHFKIMPSQASWIRSKRPTQHDNNLVFLSAVLHVDLVWQENEWATNP